jgi:hypothetical protein
VILSKAQSSHLQQFSKQDERSNFDESQNENQISKTLVVYDRRCIFVDIIRFYGDSFYC